MADSLIQMQTLEQQRAKKAWGDIQAIKCASFAQEYRSLARSFPAYILTNGLAVALAFLKAKGGQEHQELYGHLQAWLARFAKGKDLLETLLESDTYLYMQVTEEALAFVVWLKRFAEAEISKK